MFLAANNSTGIEAAFHQILRVADKQKMPNEQTSTKEPILSSCYTIKDYTCYGSSASVSSINKASVGEQSAERFVLGWMFVTFSITGTGPLKSILMFAQFLVLTWMGKSALEALME
jgi:hypothetical protein